MSGWGGGVSANFKQGRREDTIQIPESRTLRWGGTPTRSWG